MIETTSPKLLIDSGLTHSQVQIWTGQQVHPQSSFCNMTFSILIDGAIDPLLFQNAWQTIVDESDALRTFIETENGFPYKRLHPKGTCRSKFIDYSSHANPSKTFQDWAKTQCSRPLPLNGELVESYLIKLSDSKHAWYLNQHHLITDAASTVLLFKSVSEIYKHLENATNAPSFSLGSYYESSQVAYAKSEAFRNKAITHWADKSSDLPRSAHFYGKLGNAEETRSTRIEHTLSTQETNAIKRLSEVAEFASFFPDISIYGVFSTLLSALVSRVSGESKASFDSPAGNRPTHESKKSLGCFIEMFPLDIELEIDDSFRSLGSRCMEEIREYLVNICPGASSPNGANSSNIVLNYFPQTFGKFSDFNIEANWISSGHIDGVYDFKLQVHDYNDSGRYVLQLDLSDCVFTAYDRERILHHLKALLAALIENLDTSIASIPILTADEVRRTQIEFNNTSLTTPPQDTVIERIEQQVTRAPDKIALRELSDTLTYRELWEQSETIAANLQNKGACPDSVIALILPRSLQALVAILGILRSGAAYLPIDPNYPTGRISKIVTDAKPLCVITAGSNHFRAELAACYSLEDLQLRTSDFKYSKLKGDALAYVIYTSGSTGQPKGVEIEHCGLIDYIDWAERSYIRGKELTYPLFTSLSFDLTVTSLFLPLVTGGELIVYPANNAEIDSAIIDVINDNKVDFVKLTPSHLSLLKQIDLSHSRVTRLVVGGEDLRASLARSINGQFPNEIELYNEYGPTECVVGCMIHKFDPTQNSSKNLSVPIGKPADHVSIQLLNDKQIPVPEGVPGELYISRNGLARGYRNDPEKTQKSFLISNNGKRMYRTGDIARFSDKGIMTYLGRADNQVKIAGHRIELGEIENALLEHPEIKQAFITTHTPDSLNRSSEKAAHCTRCGLSSHYPNIVFNHEGVCGVCQSFESIQREADAYFHTPKALTDLFEKSRRVKDPKYDCMVFYSGGKDSSYTLGKLVDMGLSVYAFTLDNGYLSKQAMSNISRVVDALDIDHEFATTPAMNEIFRDSLTRFSNVCNGCFKTIYTLGMNRARELKIPIIVTGLSRGQFFETRLTENLFQNGQFSPDQVDTAVLEARKRYHKTQDATTRCLDTRNFETDDIFDEIQFIDFYRYVDASLEDLYRYLEERLPWIRPADTGRSTNCLVNDVGIYIHKKERGFHNYELPYSWDVRLGHKKRNEALEELDDQYQLDDVRRMLSEIGYDENRLISDSPRKELIAYYESEREISPQELSKLLDFNIPSPMQPRRFIKVERMPLTINGKIDTTSLPSPKTVTTPLSKESIPPEGPVQEHVFELWAQTLGIPSFCVDDSFFQLGGTSLSAMEITLQLCRDFEIDLPLQSIFQHPTVAQLSEIVEAKIMEEIEELSDEEAGEMLENDT